MKIEVQSLSTSTVNSFLLCPEQFWLDKIEKEPKCQQSANLVNGVAIHAAAESWFRSIQHKVPLSLDVLKRVYRITWEKLEQIRPVSYDAKNREEIMANAELLLELLMAEDIGEVVGVEIPVKYSISSDLDFIGRVDFVTRNSDGQLVIWDLKSSARRYSDDDFRRVCEQLVLYRGVLAEPAHLKVMTLVKTKEPVIESHNLLPTKLNVKESELTERFRMVKRSIEAGVHFKNRGWQCNGCGFAHVCNADERNGELELHFISRRVA